MVLNLIKVMRSYKLRVMIFSKEGETASRLGRGGGGGRFHEKGSI